MIFQSPTLNVVEPEFADKINFEGLEDEVRQELVKRISNGDLNAE